GSTALTVTPVSLSASARASVSRWTPALEAAQAAIPGAAFTPPLAPTLTIRPAALPRISGSAPRVALRQVFVFSANSRSKAAGSPSSTVCQTKPPATLTSTSRPPSRSPTAAKAAFACAASVRSTPPCTKAPSGAGPEGAMSISASCMPWLAAPCATACPRTPKAPVIAIVRPLMGGCLSETLDDRHVGHAAAFAHGLQTPALAAVLQGVDERGHQLGARGAQRVAEGDGAAVDVQLVRVRAGGVQPGHRHRREGLVDLEQVDVVDLHARPLERPLGRRQRRFQHDHRVVAQHRQVVDAGQRRQVQLLQRLFRDDHHARGAVADLAGGGGGDRPAFLQQLHALDAFEADVEADALVDRVIALGAVLVLHLQ